MQTYELVVTRVGSGETLGSVQVEASDWLSALSVARRAIGEVEGIPRGASATHSVDGSVSILDSRERKQYQLRPLGNAPALATSPDAQPSSAAVGQAVEPAAAPSPEARKSKRPAKKTAMYSPQMEQPAPPSKPKRAQTMAFEAIKLKAPVPTDTVVEPNQTNQKPADKAVPKLGQPKPKPDLSEKNASASALRPATPAKPATAPPPFVADRPSADVPLRTFALELLHERNQERTSETPITYRERSFFVSGNPDPDELERLLRSKQSELTLELNALPRGKLVKLAIFGHRWKSKPEAPPLAQLEWKDWRTEPSISIAARTAPKVSSPFDAPAISGFAVSALPIVPPTFAPAEPLPAQAPPANDFLKPVFTQPGQKGQGDRFGHAFEAMSDLFFLGSPLEGAEFCMKLAFTLIPSEGGMVGLYDVNADELRWVVSVPNSARKGSASSLNQGLISAGLRGHLAVQTFEQANADARYVEALDKVASSNQMMVAKVSKNNQLLGAIVLADRSEGLFDPEDQSIMRYIAEKFADFLAEVRVGRR